MKAKKLILIAVITSFAFSVHAKINIGIRAGISSSTVKLKDYNNADYQLGYKSGDLGYHFGVIGQVKVLKFFVQPELLFSVAKTAVTYKDLTGSNDTLQYGKQAFYKLDLPIMVGIKLRALKLQVGPVVTWQISSKSTLLDKYNINPDLKAATIGYQAGIGLELGSLLLDVKYEGSLSKLGAGMNIGGTQVNFDQRMSAWIGSIGYFF
jgi:hypothetical protein